MTRIHEQYMETGIPLCRTKGKDLSKQWPQYRIKKYEITPVTCISCLSIRKSMEETKAALEKHGWYTKLVAEELGINRCNVWDRVKKFGLIRPPGNRRYSAQREKTHCKRGHFYDRLNTYVTKGGHRKCRECDRLYKTKAYERRQNEIRVQE